MFRLKARWTAAIAMALAVFGFAALLSAVGVKDTQAQAGNPGWGLVANIVPGDANLTSVFMLDQNNAWVAGSEGTQGVIYRLQWRDGSWLALPDPYFNQTFADPVNSVVAVSDDNVWVAGGATDGLIAHGTRSGSSWSWSVQPEPLVGKVMTTIQMLGDGQEGWAGGVAKSTPQSSDGQPVMLHYSNGGWTADQEVQGQPYIYRPVNSLHFVAGGGYAVGINQIWRYDGSRWSEETLPQLLCLGGSWLYGVRALTSDDAWAVGEDFCSGPPTGPRPALLHRADGNWQRLSLYQMLNGQLNGVDGVTLRAVSFTDDGLGLFVGGQSRNPPPASGPLLPFVASYRPDGTWHYEGTPDVQSVLQSVSQADATHALAVGTNGLILSYGYGPGSTVPTVTPTHTPVVNPNPFPLPSQRIGDPKNPLVTYFPETGHTIAGGFRDYWNAHGGLEQFGYPITEEFQEISPTNGKMYTVQYFERARFEWHPDNKPPYDVMLGLLGRTITQGRENEAPFLPAQPKKSPGFMYFPATEHNMTPQFVLYWQKHGGLPVYGYPISEAFMEVSKADGKPYLVQYFERNRLEYHPELPEAYRVSLGLLGTEVLRARGWIQ